MYALKKEVAVMAHAPHYALFFSKAYPGSVHDYKIHKEIHGTYTNYLRKTPAEIRSLREVDGNNNRWAILLDRGYTGPAEDTPTIRRIAIAKEKALLTTEDVEKNQILAEIRVHVECFFGRMYQLFPFLSKPYPFSHKYFDMDIENIIMLTNEMILATHPLAAEDREFYLQRLKERLSEKEQKEKKQKEQKTAYRKRKQREWDQYHGRGNEEETDQDESSPASVELWFVQLFFFV